MNFNYLAATVAKTSIKLCSCMHFSGLLALHMDVQPLPVKGNASAPKASEMTLSRQLLAYDSLSD
jgi:hypothetical protein